MSPISQKYVCKEGNMNKEQNNKTFGIEIILKSRIKNSFVVQPIN